MMIAKTESEAKQANTLLLNTLEKSHCVLASLFKTSLIDGLGSNGVASISLDLFAQLDLFKVG